MDKYKRFKIETAGFQAGMLEKMALNLEDMQKDITEYWGGLKPRTQHAIMGAGLGMVPGGLYGALKADEDARKGILANILTSGLYGGLLGGGAGYMMPLNPEELLTRQIRTPESEEEKKLGKGISKALALRLEKMGPMSQIHTGLADIFGWPEMPAELQKHLKSWQSGAQKK